MSRRLDELNSAVTAAILEAEGLERRGEDARARDAYLKVAIAEAQIAAETPPDCLEGRAARLGAIRAALKAGDPVRALAFVETQYDEMLGRAPPFRRGQRVQLHPGTDQWAMGDRFGDVVECERERVLVRLDRSRRKLWFAVGDVLALG